jgi:hypothetical protein
MFQHFFLCYPNCVSYYVCVHLNVMSCCHWDRFEIEKQFSRRLLVGEGNYQTNERIQAVVDKANSDELGQNNLCRLLLVYLGTYLMISF